jgi:DNA-binding protein HU-beta
MTKADLLKTISANTTVPQTVIGKVLSELGAVFAAEIKATGKFEIPDVGIFTVSETSARKGRNPRTGEAIEIAAGKKVKFKAVKAVRDSL